MIESRARDVGISSARGALLYNTVPMMPLSRSRSALAVAGTSAITLIGCIQQPLKLTKDDSPVVLSHQSISAPNPGLAGTYAVRTLAYGSGTDKRRAVFRDSVTLKTKTVDGSTMVSAPPEIAKSRQKYWGFDFKKLPINGRVWYPQGDGPFPLVLIVHGNHNMKDFSDPGYGYLGQHLASRGFILASVDENFINGNLRGENDGRGWLLLEHLKRWRTWNDSLGSPFYHKVDMGNIALMGHSRGGEAVAVAAAFNRLSHYPDDATMKFNYNFDIKSIVAIAPVDGQYQPAGKPTPVENVNYLVFHGSHDGDVSAFSGLRQYQRIRFTDGRPWFKSAVYVYRANHGQWNTVWGNKDSGPRSGRFLALSALIGPEEQRQFGRVYIGGFLEATLKGKKEYLPMFRDHRTIGQWLPRTMYITRFSESSFRAVAGFDEDVDVTTGSVAGVTISADSLSGWKEAPIPIRSRNSDLGTNAVWLGWNNKPVGKDTTKPRAPASYTISISDSLRSAWSLGEGSSVVLSLAPTPATPGPRKTDRDTTKKADSSGTKAKPDTKVASARKKPGPDKAAPDTTPVDLTVELVDASGGTARVPLSQFGKPRRPLEITVYRRKGRDKTVFPNPYELVLQTYVMPVREFARGPSGFDASRVRSIRLVFDRTRVGQVVVDDIGFAAIDPAYLAAR
jgi:dienelactone hydrolase